MVLQAQAQEKTQTLCFHGQGLYLCNFESHACLWTTEGRITVFLKHGECAAPHLRRAATLRRTVVQMAKGGFFSESADRFSCIV